MSQYMKFGGMIVIEAQVREIDQMKQLIVDLEANPVPEDAPDLKPVADR